MPEGIAAAFGGAIRGVGSHHPSTQKFADSSAVFEFLSRGEDSNPQPENYKFPALPLSYLGLTAFLLALRLVTFISTSSDFSLSPAPSSMGMDSAKWVDFFSSCQ